MSQVEILEQTVKQLSPGELDAFHAWFIEFDAAEWDRRIERDSDTGKLDRLAQNAIEEHLLPTCSFISGKPVNIDL